MKKNYFNLLAPETYQNTAVIGHETTVEMAARLDWMALQPEVILDIGCGVGEGSALLKKRYPSAHVFAMDQANSFLSYGKEIVAEDVIWVHGDAHHLPIRSYTVDLIFANLLLPWCDKTTPVLQEWYRVLKPGGLIMFSCLGPDTLQELDESVKNLLLPNLIDMHNIGDEVLQVGFKEPVMDMQHFTLTYQSSDQLGYELYHTGMLIENKTLSAGNKITYEVIYGHAWGGVPSSNGSTEVRVPVSILRSDKK